MKQKKPSSLTRILGYAGGHKNLTILGCILSALSAVLGLAPYLCVWLVARSVLSTWPGLDGAGNLGLWGWMAVWTAVGSILLYFAALMSTHIAAFRTARNIRRAAMTHVLKLPLGFFAGNQSGRLRKLIDDNAGLTEDLLAHKLPDLAATAVTPIAAIVVLFLFDWRMGLLCLLTMVLALLSMCMMMGGKNAGFFHRYQQEIERMSGEAVEYVRGIPVVKMFQQTVYSFKAFYAAIQDYSDLASQYAMSCRMGQTCFLTFINGAFALLIPAALLIASGGDVRTALVNLIFYALFAPACGQMINRIMYMSEAVMEADEAIGRLDEILSQKPMGGIEGTKEAGWRRRGLCTRDLHLPRRRPARAGGCELFRPVRPGGGFGGSIRRGKDHRRQPDSPVLGCGQRQRHRGWRGRAGAGQHRSHGAGGLCVPGYPAVQRELAGEYPGCPAGCIPGGGACRRTCRPVR